MLLAASDAIDLNGAGIRTAGWQLFQSLGAFPLIQGICLG